MLLSLSISTVLFQIEDSFGVGYGNLFNTAAGDGDGNLIVGNEFVTILSISISIRYSFEDN